MNLSSPFSEESKSGMSISYHNIGRGNKTKKKKGERDLEYLQYGGTYTDKEEIELCLTCPYKKCRAHCDRIRNHRKMKSKGKEIVEHNGRAGNE